MVKYLEVRNTSLHYKIHFIQFLIQIQHKIPNSVPYNKLSMIFMLSYLISMTLISSKCSIIYQKSNSYTSNNRQINLTHTSFSENFMVGVSNDSVVYKSVLSNNNLFQVEVVNIPNFTLQNILSIQIMQNQSRGISAIMIYNSSRVLMAYAGNNSINVIDSANEFQIGRAVMGQNANQLYLYQLRITLTHDDLGNQIDNQWILIQKYQNNILVNQTSFITHSWIYYQLKTIIYFKDKLFLTFNYQVIVYSTITWDRLFQKIILSPSYIFKTDTSVSENYLTLHNRYNFYVVSLSDWSLMCEFNQTQLIYSVKIVQNYTFYTTQTKIVQFDNDICEAIDLYKLTKTDFQYQISQYQIQYSHLTKQIILYRRFCGSHLQIDYNWYCQYVQQCFGSTFLYLYSFDYAYLSNSRSCLPTYGYLAGRCIKNYGRSQPPPRPPPPKQISPITNISTEVESTPPTSTLQTMIIPTATLLVSVLIRYLAYLLIFYCFKFGKVKSREKQSQKWWNAISESKDKSIRLLN